MEDRRFDEKGSEKKRSKARSTTNKGEVVGKQDGASQEVGKAKNLKQEVEDQRLEEEEGIKGKKEKRHKKAPRERREVGEGSKGGRRKGGELSEQGSPTPEDREKEARRKKKTSKGRGAVPEVDEAEGARDPDGETQHIALGARAGSQQGTGKRYGADSQREVSQITGRESRPKERGRPKGKLEVSASEAEGERDEVVVVPKKGRSRSTAKQDGSDAGKVAQKPNLRGRGTVSRGELAEQDEDQMVDEEGTDGDTEGGGTTRLTSRPGRSPRNTKKASVEGSRIDIDIGSLTSPQDRALLSEAQRFLPTGGRKKKKTARFIQ